MTEKARFAAGCFWGVEEHFRLHLGVLHTAAGYSGGNFAQPTYEDVCSGKTGHAEAVELEYDPRLLSYQELLAFFFQIHDPSQLNRQGADRGSQYRSMISTFSPEQNAQAQEAITTLRARGQFIVTELVEAAIFWPAEEYHQKYVYKRNTARSFRG